MKQLFRAYILLIPVLFSYTRSQAQDANWTLQRAVQYALDHNLTIQQNELNRRLEKLTLQQSRLAQLPNVNLSTGYGRSFGRSIDPTSNQFVDGASYDFMSLSGSADVLLFGWFQRRNRIAQGKFNLAAAGKELEQLQNDISLNVATGYLRILLAREQVKINEQQVALSKEQLDQTKSFAVAGRVPELNVAQLEAQLATDSSNLISALTEYNSAVLDIKALLNLDFEVPFEATVQRDIESDFSNAFIQPGEIYAAAVRRLPAIDGAKLRLSAARKGHAAAVGGLYPQLALSVQAGTNYSTLNKDYNFTGGSTISPVQGTYAYDSAGNSIYQVYQATPVFTTNTLPLGQQLDNNFRQTISIGVNIPLFNAWQAQTTARQAKINMLTQQLNLDQAELKLKQDVYKAHNDARNALQKYYASIRAADAARRAQEFARKRNELGLTNTVEYLVIQNNWYKAEANMVSAKYDLIFKLKVIDFYLGNELKL